MVSWISILGSTAAGIGVVLAYLRLRLDRLIRQAADEFEAKLRTALTQSPKGSPLPINRLWVESVVRVSSKRLIGAALSYAGSTLIIVSLVGVVAVDLGLAPSVEVYILLPATLLMILFWGAFASAFVTVMRERETR